jgi:hypothetical protein
MRMGVLKNTVLALAVVASLITPAVARQFTDDEKTGLADAIAKFDAAMKANDFNTVVEASISPKLMTAMATNFKVPENQLKTLVVQQMTQAMQAVKIDSYGMDVANADYEEAKDGTPYALVPSVVVMEVSGKKVNSSGSTLALIDDGKWYLLNVGQKDQVAMLKSVYTSFADVTFPEAKMEAAQ